VIAGSLAALALALGFVTLAMNQTASKAATTHVIVPLKDRHRSATPGAALKKPVKATAAKPTKKVVVKRPDANLTAALKAGLPRSVAQALAMRRIVVVQLWSSTDTVGKLSAAEAQAGAALSGAAYVGVDVNVDGGAASVLTAALGKIPEVPAVLVYTRPATLSLTLPGFNDRTAVQQAVSTAGAKAVDSSATAAAAAAK
jgi:hypothetical protein